MTDILQTLGLTPEVLSSFQELLIVLGIGLLLGVEREHSKREKGERLFAGVRTFPIVTLTGYLALYLADRYSVLIYVAALVAVVVIIGLAYIRNLKKDIGTTTEFALLIGFILGSLVFTQAYYLAVTITVVVVALLNLKIQLHAAAEKLSEQDISSILYFVIITGLVLPLLPNQDMGPYDIVNPYKIWLIVAIFVTLNFLAYFLSKFLSEKKSTILTGILGGFASSTATTWYFSRQSALNGGDSARAAAILLASSIMFPRLLIWLLLLNQQLFQKCWIPVAVLGLIGLTAGIVFSRKKTETTGDGPLLKNPINFREALIFAGVYLFIKLIVGFAEDRFGHSGVLLAAGISGLTDVDAITISMADFGRSATELSIASAAVIIAAITNTLVKYGFCLVFGSPSLKRFTSYGFLPILLLGLGYIVFRLVW